MAATFGSRDHPEAQAGRQLVANFVRAGGGHAPVPGSALDGVVRLERLDADAVQPVLERVRVLELELRTGRHDDGDRRSAPTADADQDRRLGRLLDLGGQRRDADFLGNVREQPAEIRSHRRRWLAKRVAVLLRVPSLGPHRIEQVLPVRDATLHLGGRGVPAPSRTTAERPNRAAHDENLKRCSISSTDGSRERRWSGRPREGSSLAGKVQAGAWLWPAVSPRGATAGFAPATKANGPTFSRRPVHGFLTAGADGTVCVVRTPSSC